MHTPRISVKDSVDIVARLHITSSFLIAAKDKLTKAINIIQKFRSFNTAMGMDGDGTLTAATPHTARRHTARYHITRHTAHRHTTRHTARRHTARRHTAHR